MVYRPPWRKIARTPMINIPLVIQTESAFSSFSDPLLMLSAIHCSSSILINLRPEIAHSS